MICFLSCKKYMPEGPSLYILKEASIQFKGKKILLAEGNAAIDKSRLLNKKITDIKTWGKQYFICLPGITVRIHMLMFGSYSINEQTKPAKSTRLHLRLSNGDIYFYTCSVKILEDDLNELYDWEADVMSDEWNQRKAIKKLKTIPGSNICDALLDQQIFSGVGNIIKNEILYRTKVHTYNTVGDIPARKLNELAKQARVYSFEFLEWKKNFELKKHWLAHTKKTCHRCNLPILKEYIGKTKRRAFFCNNCQVIYH